MLSVTMMLYN